MHGGRVEAPGPRVDAQGTPGARVPARPCSARLAFLLGGCRCARARSAVPGSPSWWVLRGRPGREAPRLGCLGTLSGDAFGGGARSSAPSDPHV